MTKVQVRLQDGTYTNFTAFAVDNGDGTVNTANIIYMQVKQYIVNKEIRQCKLNLQLHLPN